MQLLSDRELQRMTFPIPADTFWDELEDDIPSLALLWEHY